VQYIFPGRAPNLERWRERAIHPLAPKELVPSPFHDRLVVTLAMEPEGPPVPGGPFDRLADCILRYDVFGPTIGRGYLEHEFVEPGATVGLEYRFAPFLSLFFASRVVRVFEREETEFGWSTGFAYQTLTGHPELGEEIFEVTKLRTGPVIFRMEAWSRPNLWYVTLFTPWARWIQKRAAQRAREYLSSKLSS